MNICLFAADEIEKPLSLRDERARHLIKILHKKVGDAFSAGVVGGMAGTATIMEITTERRQTGGKDFADGEIHFTFAPETDGKPLAPLALIIGFPRPIQLKRLLRDAACLGAAEVHLAGTELGEKSYMRSTLIERGAAEKMLLDGAAQAGSTHAPALFLHETLALCLREICGDSPAQKNRSAEKLIKIALDNVDEAGPLVSFLDNSRERLRELGLQNIDDAAQNANTAQSLVVAAIGSERGWSGKERALLEANGFTRCSMGKRIFRTETAATVASTLILAAMGRLE